MKARAQSRRNYGWLIFVTSLSPSNEVCMSLIKNSRQMWKIVLSFVVALICGCIIIFQSLLYEPIGAYNTMRLVGAAAGLCFLVFAWASFSIRCPNCQLKLFWYAVQKFKVGDWFTELLNLSKCTVCAYSMPSKKKRD